MGSYSEEIGGLDLLDANQDGVVDDRDDQVSLVLVDGRQSLRIDVGALLETFAPEDAAQAGIGAGDAVLTLAGITRLTAADVAAADFISPI